MDVKQSHCGFVVIKLRLKGESYYLMRMNLKWRDVSFIGGHEIPKDQGSLMRAARRELVEEVPSFRGHLPITLSPLVEHVAHGPVYSRSAEQSVEYEFSFFLARFGVDPRKALEQVGPRSLNVLVSEKELLDPQKYDVAGLIDLLHKQVSGGLGAIPLSWHEDLGESIVGIGSTVLPQRELSFR